MTQALTDRLRSWLPRLDPRNDEELGRDLDDEFAFHLEELARECRAEGMDEEAARDEARRRFGDVEKVRRQCARIARQEQVMLQRINFVLMIIVLLVVAGVGVQVAITQRYNTLALQAITNDLANMKFSSIPGASMGTAYISGDIKRPGAYSLPAAGKLTLTQLIMASGGPSIGQDATIRLNRGQELDAMTEEFSYSELIASPRTAPAMQAGDTVIVVATRPRRPGGVSEEVLDTNAIVGDWVLTDFGDEGEVKLTIISDDDIRNTSGMKGGEVIFPGIESPVDLRFASYDRAGNLSVSGKSMRFDGRQRKARWSRTEDGGLIVNLSEYFEDDARFAEPLVFRRVRENE